MLAGRIRAAPQQSEELAKGGHMIGKGVGDPSLLVYTLRQLHPFSSRLGPYTSHAGLKTT